jgi:hypothetical protein
LVAEEDFMALDRAEFAACLDEMDRCLFNAAAHEECNGFHKNTQLTAVLTLLVRCSSLLRSMLQLFESGATDSFQVVLRAFEEAWYIALYFRFQDQHVNAAKWQAEVGGKWSPPISELVEFAKARGVPEPTMGKDYGRLSEVAHPTKSAAFNSVTLCGARLGIPSAIAELAEERKNEEDRFSDALYRLVWATLDGDKQFIALHISKKDLPFCAAYVQLDEHLELNGKDGHTPQKSS